MSHEFRSLLRKVGSGPHTSKNLTRSEAEIAMRLMLEQEATPAQIGAFLISHRIKRATGEELAGMADAYDALGPQLAPIDQAPITFCHPYDGRSRTAPLGPLTALVIATLGRPVILHGGDRVPTKDGVSLMELWRCLAVNWSHCPLTKVQQILQTHGIGFMHLPQHFMLAQNLMPYRDQIGKRPPIATLELLWSPYSGEQMIVSGYVHPPTEKMFRDAFKLRNVRSFLTIKGLEGSCDLPCDRTLIAGYQTESEAAGNESGEEDFKRLTLAPRAYGFAASEVPLMPLEDWSIAAMAALRGEPGVLTEYLVWNAGFYWWRSGGVAELEAGFEAVRSVLAQGKVFDRLQALQAALPLSCDL